MGGGDGFFKNTKDKMNTKGYLDMELLRFTTAGSVDDGKSTLIGRLLYDSKSIFEDQLEAVEQASRNRGNEEDCRVFHTRVYAVGRELTCHDSRKEAENNSYVEHGRFTGTDVERDVVTFKTRYESHVHLICRVEIYAV